MQYGLFADYGAVGCRTPKDAAGPAASPEPEPRPKPFEVRIGDRTAAGVGGKKAMESFPPSPDWNRSVLESRRPVENRSWSGSETRTGWCKPDGPLAAVASTR